MRSLITTAVPILCLFALPSLTRSEEGKDEKSAAEAKSATKVSGVFESTETQEVSAKTQQIKSLVINKIVPHGTIVRKGQAIVWFETEDIDKQLSTAETDLRLAELAMRGTEFDFREFQEVQKLDKAAAQRTRRNARQDYDNFVKTDRDRRIASAEFSLKTSKASLANVMEEFNQLEKMYKEDELTEESEEIVLKRAKQAVESAQFRLKGTEIQTQRSLAQTIPRSQEQQEDSLARQQLAYDKAMHALQAARRKREIELEREKTKLEKQQADFKQLRDDRKRLVIQAPSDGILYHGQMTRGRLSDKPSALKEGSTVTNKQILATVVNPAKLQIRAELQEKDLPHVKVGAKGQVTPTAFPARKLEATVESLSLIPLANNKFDCVIKVKMGDDEPAIMPGMTCSIEFAAKPKE